MEHSSVVISDIANNGLLICGSGRGTVDNKEESLVAIDSKSGETVWQQSFPARIADFEIDDDITYAWGVNTGVFSFDVETGEGFNRLDVLDGYLHVHNELLFTATPLNVEVVDLATNTSKRIDRIPQITTPLFGGSQYVIVGTELGI